MATYGLEIEGGGQLGGTWTSRDEALAAAQRRADERGETVYVVSSEGADDAVDAVHPDLSYICTPAQYVERVWGHGGAAVQETAERGEVATDDARLLARTSVTPEALVAYCRSIREA